MSSPLNMPVPPEGYCTRQYSASSRMKIVASDHDLGLCRTITRVPSGHLLSGSGAPDAGTLDAAGSLPVAAAASSAPALGRASLGSSLTERSGLVLSSAAVAAVAISASTSPVVGAVFQTISNRPSSRGLMPKSTVGALPLAIIFSAARLALLRAVKLEAVVSIGFSYGDDDTHARRATEVQSWSDQSLCHVAVNEMCGAGPFSDRH